MRHAPCARLGNPPCHPACLSGMPCTTPESLHPSIPRNTTKPHSGPWATCARQKSVNLEIQASLRGRGLDVMV
jgi:hypothetical protein